MLENENNQNNQENEEKKKKRIFLILLLLLFLVPIGFGIYALIPDRPVPVKTYDVQLVNDYGGGLTISKNKAYEDYNFSADIIINYTIITDKIMPNALDSSDVKCNNQPISFTYNTTSQFSAKINIPKESINGNITINVPLITPIDTFPVTLKANGGKFINGSTEIIVNAYAGCKLTDLHGQGYSRPNQFREGYHFTHWELETDRSKKLYEDTPIPYAPGGATYVANCELNTIKVNINPGVDGKFPSMQPEEWLRLTTLYDTPINQIAGYPGEPTKAGYKFLYYQDINNKHYLPTDTVTIPDEWDDNFGLVAVYKENLIITLDPNGGSYPGGTPGPFDTYYGITLSELEGYVAPNPPTAAQEFTHWTIAGDTTLYYKNTPIDKAGSITLVANYSECQHEEFEGYTVIDNKLHGICKDCKAQILISDSDLPSYSGKFLMIEQDEDSSDDNYVMHDISEMAGIVNIAAAHSVLDIYFINGEYELGGSRGAGQQVITVKAHGLLNNEGEPNASIDCTRATEWPEPRHHHLINFVFDNLNMIGEDDYKDGFYFGLYASTITYNYCYFKGKQSFYSDQVICNDCVFDSTGMLTEPDYAIYSYSSYNIEFNRCVFNSDGKALKIFAEGAAPDAVFKLTDCNFYNIGKIRTDKAAIEVDSQYQPIDSPYNVYITRCHQEGFIGEDGNGLYHDSVARANFIVTEI